MCSLWPNDGPNPCFRHNIVVMAGQVAVCRAFPWFPVHEKSRRDPEGKCDGQIGCIKPEVHQHHISFATGAGSFWPCMSSLLIILGLGLDGVEKQKPVGMRIYLLFGCELSSKSRSSSPAEQFAYSELLYTIVEWNLELDSDSSEILYQHSMEWSSLESSRNFRSSVWVPKSLHRVVNSRFVLRLIVATEASLSYQIVKYKVHIAAREAWSLMLQWQPLANIFEPVYFQGNLIHLQSKVGDLKCI